MRDYIILNGVNSNTITGLLISTLPPITKPKIRTQTEEIDGRDGDIITKLGYSAYDKEIEIGLYGDFDIDDVIAYFNSEGTVTFSNEPDKFYNYQILDQIDYEKLIRFKKAKVKMHVQPFKYPLEETPVEITNQYVNDEAEEIDLDNTKEAPMKIDLKGNTSNNLIDSEWQDRTLNGVTVTNNGDGTYTLNGTNTSSSAFALVSITGGIASHPLISNIANNVGKYITISTGYASNQGFYLQLNLSKQGGGGGQYGFVSGVYTYTNKLISSNEGEAVYINFFLGINANASFNNLKVYPMITIQDNQISTAPTPSDFEPYGASVTGDNSIEVVGKNLFDSSTTTNYKYLDGNSGVIYDSSASNVTDYIEVKAGKKYIFNYTYTSLVSPNGRAICFYSSDKTFISGQSIIYTPAQNPITINTPNNACYVRITLDRNMQNIVVYDNDTSSSYPISLGDIELNTGDSIQYITDKWYIVRANETQEEITDATLISQLQALKNATSYDTKTHISQTNDSQPFILNATAIQKGSGETTVTNEGNIYSKPILDIEGSGTIGIYLEGNQMFSVDLSNATECIIDTAQLEAYNPSTDALMNRQVTGDYSNFKLNAGENQVSITGEITKVTISNYTRWL